MKIIRFIKNLKTKIEQIKKNCEEQVNKLSKYYNCLENGEYRAGRTFDVYYNVRYNRVAQREERFIIAKLQHSLKTHYIDFSTYLAEKIVCKFYKIRIYSEHKEFNGHAICISSSGNEARIIDYEKNSMLTVFKDNNSMQNLCEKRKKLSEFFLTPKIIETNNKKSFIIEEYKQKKSISSNKRCKLLMGDILNFQQSSAYKNHIEQYTDSFAKQFNIELNRLNLNYAELFFNFIKQGYYKKCLCHGDLYRFNMIYNNKKLYYIDYDGVGENHIFFFDAIYYIVIEIYHFKNYLPYKNYIKGKYDKFFESLFRANGVVFNTLYKKMYCFIVLCETFRGGIPKHMVDLVK